MSEFDAIDIPSEEVTVGGHTYTVRPLTIAQLPPFARLMNGVLPAIVEGLKDGLEIAGILRLLGDHGEALIAAVVIALKADRAQIEELSAVDFVQLVLPIIKVNSDYFARSLSPAVQAVVTQAAGQTPSSA